MSQKTNLNVSPYYDDFDANQNFYRVLFRPGFPVQSRELTTVQSILQNQIESLGNNIFKDGSVVIPGNVTYNSLYYAVKLNPTHVGLSVGLYLNELIGKKIKGQTSQLTAVVQNVITDVESTTDDYTIYVKYITSDNNFKINQFTDGESLLLQENLTYGNTTINSGDTFATLIDSGASSIASAVSISEGVYYLRGHFVTVDDHTIILDQYTNTPSYRVGLSVIESFVTSQEDPTLYDNARGFSNYAAPGADRLKISATLSKKTLTDFDDKNFVEVLRVTNGVVKKIQDTDNYSLIKEYIAKRTYEESGDYIVDPFSIEVNESLNDKIDSDGIFYSDQKTDQGNTPSDDLLAVKVSPGKAYVKGFDVDKSLSTILDVEKPRDTKKIATSSVPFEMGNTLVIDNVHGTPRVGIDNNFTVSLNSQRRTSTTHYTSGNIIGAARVYSITPINNTGGGTWHSNKWNLNLWDIQTYTNLTLSANSTNEELPKDAYIKGLSSGASGYSVSGGSNGNNHNLVQTSGSFRVGERVSVNETLEHTRTITAVKQYSVEDIKSVYQGGDAEGQNNPNSSGSTGLTTAFAADTVLHGMTPKGFSSNDIIQINNAGIATVTGRNFTGIKNDAIISYTVPGNTKLQYNKVDSISSDGLTATLTAVTTVANHLNGALPTAGNDYKGTFQFAVPHIQGDDKKQLYAPLNSKNVSEVDLAGSTLAVKRQASGKATSDTGAMTVTLADVGITDGSFEPYQVGRYSVHYSDGVVDTLDNQKVTLGNNSQNVVFSGLVVNQTNVRVNVTVNKNVITNKNKLFQRSAKLDITKTSVGVNTVTVIDGQTTATGLTTSVYHGLRIEDNQISLNKPDVANVVAVYEAVGVNGVQLDTLTFPGGLNLNSASVLGEKITGSTSGAVGRIVTRKSTSEIEFVYLNSSKFVINETVRFDESKISSIPIAVTKGNYIDKTQEYTLDKGQREQYYDYSRIVRKGNVAIPSRPLTVIFDHYSVPDNDSGDVYTVDSYGDGRYKNDIPTLNGGNRASDVLDFRPKVADFSSTIYSPFSFQSRSFEAAGSNPTLVVASNESSVVGYSYYLPRIDSIVLNKDSELSVVKGVSSDHPKPPSSIQEGMEIAQINLPAYLYDTNSITKSFRENKRYTMRDIGELENRIENLEDLTSLTLLELDTKTLQIRDADGIDRFKSGFFVDSFKNNNFIDNENSDTKVCIDTKNEELRSDNCVDSLKGQISPALTVNSSTVDYSSDFALLDPNIKKTGDLITLNYSENSWTDLSQNFATKKQSVNPFNVANYNGFVKLTPSSDTWARTINPETGVTLQTQSNWTDLYLDNLISSSSISNKLRSRNIEFRASSLQPSTSYYSFFGGNGNVDFIPKLTAITMVTGVFQVGENVSVYLNDKKIGCFRSSSLNHKTGSYNNATTTYTENPYSTSLSLGTTYSASSSVINVDTYSLSDNADGRFYGYVPSGAKLVGETSNAQATVNPQTLITDSIGDLIGCFFIRDPLSNPAPPVAVNVGSKTFKLTSSSTNSATTTFTETTFHSTGIVDSSSNTESIVVRKSPSSLPLSVIRRDPLSQTFRTDNSGGFLTGVDLYFAEKDTTEPVFVEIRETDIGGQPKNKLVQDFARVMIPASGITTSANGDTATNVKFPSPLYLQPEKQYSLSIISPSSDDHKVWIAESNQATVATQSYPNAQQVIYSNQYTGGNLYKPQNGSVWSSNINQDLKFKFYKANFSSTSGTAYFNNPNISIGSTYISKDDNLPKLTNNPITTYPRKLVVGIETSAQLIPLQEGPSLFAPGAQISNSSDGDVNTNGVVEYLGGNIGIITSSNVGTGYSNGTYSNVPLYPITGVGENATATVVVTNNKIDNVAIANTGTKYKVGDVLGLSTSSMTRGSDALISVSSVPTVDTIFLTNVSGQNFGAGQDLYYRDGAGTWVSVGGTATYYESYVTDSLYEGNVFEVNHYNHGMHHKSNHIVTLNGIEPNTPSIKLTADIVSTNTTISVANTTGFDKFEGRKVSGTNPGYVIVNDEIISYNALGSGTLTIVNRGLNESITRNHAINDAVQKYEFNRVSLTRINKHHQLYDLTIPNNMDSYRLKFLRTSSQPNASDKSSNQEMLNFSEERSLGGIDCRATKNIQFNEIIPQFNTITPQNTNISANIRTVSGTSSGGEESPFADQGFEPVLLNQVNEFSTPRIVASRVNEVNYLTTLPSSKSLTLGIRMETSDTNVSPVIDLSEAATFVFNRNRLNKPISDYTKDSRVNLIEGDPHSSIYISKKVNLSQPATSLKVVLNSYRSDTSDIRVLYQLFSTDSSEIEQSFQLFPGYDNLRDTDGDGFGDTVIDSAKDSGRSDATVGSSRDDEYLQYQYTANDLQEFNGFIIKIVMSGTNEATAPRIRDLRAIALA